MCWCATLAVLIMKRLCNALCEGLGVLGVLGAEIGGIYAEGLKELKQARP